MTTHFESSTKARSSPVRNFSLHAINPWEQDSRSITSIRNSLILAEKMGLRTMDDESRCAQMLAKLPSLKLIALQKEVTAQKKSLHHVKHSIAQHSQERETADVIHLNVIETRINMVKQLCTDLESVLQNTDLIVNRLVKPFSGDFIKMNAAYHKYANEVFTMLVPTLNDLSVNLDNLTWASHNDFSAAQLNNLLTEIQSLTASLHTSFHTLSQMTKGIGKLSGSSDLDSLIEPPTPAGTPRSDGTSRGHTTPVRTGTSDSHTTPVRTRGLSSSSSRSGRVK